MWDLIVSVPDHYLSFYFVFWPLHPDSKIKDFSYESIDRVETEMHSLNLPDVFSWSRTSKTKCEEALRSSEVKLKIEKLDEIVDTCSVNVQKIINGVTDVMVSAGNLFLFRQTFKAKRKKKKQKNKRGK